MKYILVVAVSAFFSGCLAATPLVHIPPECQEAYQSGRYDGYKERDKSCVQEQNDPTKKQLQEENEDLRQQIRDCKK